MLLTRSRLRCVNSGRKPDQDSIRSKGGGGIFRADFDAAIMSNMSMTDDHSVNAGITGLKAEQLQRFCRGIWIYSMI